MQTYWKITQLFIAFTIVLCHQLQAQHGATVRSVVHGEWLSPSTWTAKGEAQLPPQGAWGKGTAQTGEIIIIEHSIIIPAHTVVDLSASAVKEIRLTGSGSLNFGTNAKLKLPEGAVVLIDESLMAAESGEAVSGSPAEDAAPSLPADYSPETYTDFTMPVELLYFHSEAGQDTIQLSWATGMEDNLAYFTVERAGVEGNFEEISQMQGTGFSNHETHYHFQDCHPLPGLNLYRLKATDKEGAFAYHHIIGAWLAENHETASKK